MRIRKILAFGENVKPCEISRCCIACEPSDLSPFFAYTVKDRDNTDITVIGDDVSLLFRIMKARRFDNFDSRNLESLFGRFRSSAPDALSGLSDKDILSFVKSRYLQSPAEINAWSDYLESNMDMIIKGAAAEKAAAEKAAAEKAAFEKAAAEKAAADLGINSSQTDYL